MTGYEIDHIGIAVNSIESALPFYKALGFKDIKLEIVPTEKVKVAFIEFDNHSDIELLEPTSDDSVIRKFLDKSGEGIHHICFKTKDIQKSLDSLKAEGFRLVDESPRLGAKNCKVAFIHPKAANGVLIELSQKM
jgi:methylmalonyl-CoA/ethylmalonyl-CoA epimerase